MRRRVIGQKDSVTMTLPKKWVELRGIRAGDEIEVTELPEGLLVSTDAKAAKKHTSLALTSLTESAIRTIVTNAYRLGHDILSVSFHDETQFKVLSNIVKTRLIGFEIIKRDRKSCVIENITEPSPEQFEVLSQKFLYNISELLAALKNMLGHEEVLVDIEEIEAKIQQYNNFCYRIISKRLVNLKSPSLFWAYQTHCIHAQRELYFLIQLVAKGKVKANKDLMDYLKDCTLLFETLKSGYLKKDINLLEKIQDMEKDLVYKKGYSLLQKNKEKVAVYHLMAAIRNFYQSTSPLMGLFI